MKKLKLKKVIAVILATVSISTLQVLSADAAWVKDSNGWWNTEGDSWSVGWRLINDEWYYFDNQGYMKTGWLLDGGKWYYLSADGAMAKNTSIDGYKIGADGAWIEKVEQENTSQNNNDKENTAVTDNNSQDTKDLTMDGFISSLKDKGYNPQIKDTEKGFLKGERKIINIGDEELEVYTYNSNEEMEKDAEKIYEGGFSYKTTEETSINLSWDSYPHFYKSKNMIVLYIGKTEKIISDLNSILGHHFLGIEYRNSLKKVDDVRKIACKYLVSGFSIDNEKEDMWKSCAILDSNETSAVEENEYAVIFEREDGSKIGVTLDKDTFEELSAINID